MLNRSDKLQVRVISPWFRELETEDVYFSVDIEPVKADALFCNWAPSPELFSFPRRKAWYCCEPTENFRRLGDGTWPQIRSRLAEHEFLWHQHPDPRYRVPHMTHFEDLWMNRNSDRFERAIAIVSNFGAGPWRRRSDHDYRNRLVTWPGVDLFGRACWSGYRAKWYSVPRAPANYRGPIQGDWPDGTKRELMARYKVAVCLENMYEPHYFTEKFVEAVCAGCIPVYRAHPTVAESVLKDACWVDPVAFDNDPITTLHVALGMDMVEIRQQNEAWMTHSTALRATSNHEIFRQIGRILLNS